MEAASFCPKKLHKQAVLWKMELFFNTSYFVILVSLDVKRDSSYQGSQLSFVIQIKISQWSLINELFLHYWHYNFGLLLGGINSLLTQISVIYKLRDRVENYLWQT